MYIIVNNKGEYVYYSKQDGKYKWTSDQNLATCWQRKDKPQNLISSTLSKHMRASGVMIKEYKNIKPMLKYNARRNTTVCNVVNDFMEVVNNCQDIRQNLIEQLSEVDKKISDIDHFLEFTDTNDADTINVTRQLQEYLRERRNIKNDIALFKVLIDFKNNPSELSGITDKIEGIYNKIYTPNILNDLFVKPEPPVDIAPKPIVRPTAFATRKVCKIDAKSGEVLDVYNSLTEAANKNNGTVSMICKCTKGVTKTAYGFKWRYA